MSQDEKQNLAISVTELRAESYSADSDNIVISLRTKYSAHERVYSIPVECFRDFIIDLQRLNAAAAPTQPEQPTERTQSLLPEISIIEDTGPSPTNQRENKPTETNARTKKSVARKKRQSVPLLIDEANALFGKRAEVKDAQDR